MRAIRLYTELKEPEKGLHLPRKEWEIDETTFKAIQTLSKNLSAISFERIRDELSKIILSKNPALGIELLQKAGLLVSIIPELEEAIDKLKRKERLIVMVDSPGGEISSAITLYNIISAYKDSVCGLVTGQAVSAAFLVLQAFGVRAAFSNTVLSFHNPRLEGEESSSMTLEDIKKETRFMELFRNTMLDIFQKGSGMQRDEALKLLKSDKMLTPQKAKEKQLIDIIVPSYNGNIFKIAQELQKIERAKKIKKQKR